MSSDGGDLGVGRGTATSFAGPSPLVAIGSGPTDLLTVGSRSFGSMATGFGSPVWSGRVIGFGRKYQNGAAITPRTVARTKAGTTRLRRGNAGTTRLRGRDRE